MVHLTDMQSKTFSISQKEMPITKISEVECVQFDIAHMRETRFKMHSHHSEDTPRMSVCSSGLIYLTLLYSCGKTKQKQNTNFILQKKNGTAICKMNLLTNAKTKSNKMYEVISSATKHEVNIKRNMHIICKV